MSSQVVFSFYQKMQNLKTYISYENLFFLLQKS